MCMLVNTGQYSNVGRVWNQFTSQTKINTIVLIIVDYCNSLLYSLSDTPLSKLQSVQNATPRLITDMRRCDHITPVLCELHWLSIREHVKFKDACLIHQSLSGQAHLYLVDDCCLVSYSTRHSLRSADVPWCHKHSAVTATELLQPLDLACGTLSV